MPFYQIFLCLATKRSPRASSLLPVSPPGVASARSRRYTAHQILPVYTWKREGEKEREEFAVGRSVFRRVLLL